MPLEPAPAAAVNALHSLSSPRFPRVPGEFTFRSDAINPRLAKLAKILLDLGLLTEADAPRPARTNEQQLVELALRRWSERVIGRDLKVFGDVYLCLGADNAPQIHEVYSDAAGDPPDVDPEQCVMLSLSPWERGDTWLLERRCRQLEKGLAEFALNLVDYGAGRSVPVMTPCRAWDAFDGMLAWEDSKENIAARAAFQNTIPSWVCQPKRRLTLTELEARARHEPVAKTCLALLELIGDKKRESPDTGGHWHIVFAAVLRWSSDDLVARITDDYVHDTESSGEGTTDYSWHFVELEQDGVERFLDRFARLLRTMELTDRLISQIAEKAPE